MLTHRHSKKLLIIKQLSYVSYFSECKGTNFQRLSKYLLHFFDYFFCIQDYKDVSERPCNASFIILCLQRLLKPLVMNSDFSTSNRPVSSKRISGITGSAKNDRVINGSI